jgi:hypothetical protein
MAFRCKPLNFLSGIYLVIITFLINICHRLFIVSVVQPTWCTIYSIYWKLRASTCFEHYLLILRRRCTNGTWYISCVLCWLHQDCRKLQSWFSQLTLQARKYTKCLLCNTSWGWASNSLYTYTKMHGQQNIEFVRSLLPPTGHWKKWVWFPTGIATLLSLSLRPAHSGARMKSHPQRTACRAIEPWSWTPTSG